VLLRTGRDLPARFSLQYCGLPQSTTLDDGANARMARQLSDIIDVSRFRTALAGYLDHTYSDLKREYPDEEFYWFGLYTANDAIGHLADSAAGRNAVARLVETLVAEKPWSEWSADKRISAAKWMCADLPYHCFGADRGYHREVNQILESWASYLYNDGTDNDETKDKIHAELRSAIDQELRRFKMDKGLGELLILLTGGDVEWGWFAESAVRVNGEEFCRRTHPDLFE
jgi:hypothetical protein